MLSRRNSKSKLHQDVRGRQVDCQEAKGKEQRPSGREKLESEAVRMREARIRGGRDGGA